MAGPYVVAADLIPALDGSKEGARLRGHLINPFNDNMRFFRVAKALTMAGFANTKVMCAPGDSTTRGSGAVASSYTGLNGIGKSWPAQVADFISARGIRAKSNWWFGEGSIGNVNAPIFDPRLSIGSATRFAINSLGGPPWRLSSPGTFGFGPIDDVDTFSLWHHTHPSDAQYIGTVNVKIDAGSTIETINTQTAQLFTGRQYTTTPGAHTLNVEWATGNFCYFGVGAWNSATKEISLINAGWPGSSSSQWSTPGMFGASPLEGIKRVAPHLCIIDLGINNWSALSPVENYKADMTNIVQLLKGLNNTSILLKSPVPSSTVTASLEQQGAYVEAMRQVAVEQDVAMLDIFNKWVSRDNMLSIYRDGSHPNEAGYALEAFDIADFLLAV